MMLFAHSFIHSFIERSLILSFIHPSIRPSVRPAIYSFVRANKGTRPTERSEQNAAPNVYFTGWLQSNPSNRGERYRIDDL